MSSNDQDQGVPNWLLFLFFGILAAGTVYGVYVHGFLKLDPSSGFFAGGKQRFVTWVPSKPARSAAEITRGEALATNCKACHGQDLRGQAGLGPSLMGAKWVHGARTETDLVALIVTGISGSRLKTGAAPMPPRGNLASEADVWRVVYYLSSVNKSIQKK